MILLLVEQFYKALKWSNGKQLECSISFPWLNWLYLFPKQLKKKNQQKQK